MEDCLRSNRPTTNRRLVLAVAIVCLMVSESHQVSFQPARVKQRPSGEEVDPLQRQQQQTSSKSKYNRLFRGYQAVARASGGGGGGGGDHQVGGSDYVCAPFCSCSTVLVTDRSLASSSASSRLVSADRASNLSRVYCESSQFTDLLTIDRRSQIIHISLPHAADRPHGGDATSGDGEQQQQQPRFRMPRLAQFSRLREIIIIKLKFEVCDSEVFKRGQILLRLRLNNNQLKRLSRACLKHLDKLLELNLDHNNLTELESALFSGLTSLRSLSIAHNRLSELAAHQFVNLSRLTTLNLVGNSFKTINLHLLEPMQASLRFLLLAKNQIKSLNYLPLQQLQLQLQLQRASANQTTTTTTTATATATATTTINQLIRVGQQQFGIGLVFKNLIKLNVDENKFERIKLLQLHRFYNVKYLSIRQNEIATIRDKAFNGLKLVELNLAHNQLQTISKCAFCNSTIRRLVLSNNNISLPQPSILQLEPAPSPSSLPLSSDGMPSSSSPDQPAAAMLQLQPQPQQHLPPAPTSSQNMLILSQSIFGPLFGQLEYLDLSQNQQLADQLEFLLEPLLKLEYLNLASVGLERSLPSPSLFKNLRQLRYLNLSHNQLDQLIAETIEPLTQLEILDLSHNKFNEMDESFLVIVDEMSPPLKLLNLGSNPWYCSQCKVAPLYDWILRSPIYNLTCISPLIERHKDSVVSSSQAAEDEENDDDELKQLQSARNSLMVPLANNYPPFDNKLMEDVDLMNEEQLADSNYNLLLGPMAQEAAASAGSQKSDPLIVRELIAMNEDDPSIGQTMALVASMSGSGQAINFDARQYCLKCEFPSELSAFHIHELAPGDFKFCAGAAPRFSASEPKIGLTLALVIIGALFVIIIVVIVMYRKKSNTYYTNEDMDQLDGSARQTNGKKPVFSISSDNENNQYGDGTDYSSPPMSHSTDSYSPEEEEEDDDDDDEDLDEDEDLGEENEEEEEEEDEDEDFDGTLADEDENNDDGDEVKHQPSQKADDGEPSGSQRQSGTGSVDSQQQSRQAAEEAKQQRKNQIDEYNKRHDHDTATSQEKSLHKVTPPPPPQLSTRTKAPVASPESFGPASLGANTSRRPESSLAGVGRQPTGSKSTTSQRQQRQQSSVDSSAGVGGAIKSEGRPDLSRNHSHPQQQKLTFAEHSTSIELLADGSSVRGIKSLRTSGSNEANSKAQVPHRLESADSHHRPAEGPTRRTSQEERMPSMQQLPISHNEPPAPEQKQQQQHLETRRQHSLDKSTRRRDKQSDLSGDLTRSSLRRHQTSKEQSSCKLIQVPSQQSGPQLVQLQVQDLPVSQQADSKPEHRARQRFAISKEISQTLGGAGSAKTPAWTSGESHNGNHNQAAELRPRRGLPLTGAGSDRAGRQMGHLNVDGDGDYDDEGTSTSDDATTADSLALEQPDAGDSDEPHLAPESLVGYSGAALAMDSDTSDSRTDHEPALNSRLRPAVSSHSALTQTGSGDLLD